MTDFSEVRSLAADLSLTEATVDTPAMTDSLAALKRAMLEVQSDDPNVATWLSEEHFAGGVILTGATMNKRAELAGKGAPFDLVSRGELINRYNRWATQLVSRIDAVASGTSAAANYLPGLAQFRADPVHRQP